MWQPIETAPKGDIWFDLWVRKDGIGWRITDAFWNGSEFVFNDDGDRLEVGLFGDATHWMPLPDPPQD